MTQWRLEAFAALEFNLKRLQERVVELGRARRKSSSLFRPCRYMIHKI